MSLTNNVLEYQPGDKVIQIYPVARPLVGVVVGSNKVEGKVYVSWNGRVMQVDPEEIQLACGTSFYPISRQGSSDKQENKHILKIARALRKCSDPLGNSFHRTFEHNLVQQGMNREEADDIAKEYKDAYQKRLQANFIDPLLPMCDESVIILNQDGTKPGYVGILDSINGNNAIVDVTSGWSPVTNGSNLLEVPLHAIVPINNPTRETAEAQYPGLQVANLKNKTVSENKRIANRAFNLFLGSVKNITVYDKENIKAWVETNPTPKGSIIVSAVIEKDGEVDSLFERYPIFKQQLGGFNVRNKTDYENSLERIKPIISNCIYAIQQYVQQNIIPEYVEKELQKEVVEESDLSVH